MLSVGISANWLSSFPHKKNIAGSIPVVPTEGINNEKMVGCQSGNGLPWKGKTCLKACIGSIPIPTAKSVYSSTVLEPPTHHGLISVRF